MVAASADPFGCFTGPLFDAHFHLNDPAFSSDWRNVGVNMEMHGIKGICTGYNLESSMRSVHTAEAFSCIYAAVGIHPQYANEITAKESIMQLEDLLLQRKKVHAIGEIGLDYRINTSKELQQHAFMKQLDLASQTNTPCVLHVRGAHGDVLNELKKYSSCLPHCMIHGISASWELAKEYLKLGCMLSISGVVTWSNARKIKDIVHNVPLDRMLIETDSPYLSPEPFRHSRNEPQYLPYIIKAIAGIRKMDEDRIREYTYQNALRFFQLEQEGLSAYESIKE